MKDGRPSILEIRGLRKNFGDVEVLRGIDLSVKAQELVFVIGPSGSGKSTLLRCCNRLEEPSAGSIHVDGTDIMARSTNVKRHAPPDRHGVPVVQPLSAYDGAA